MIERTEVSRRNFTKYGLKTLGLSTIGVLSLGTSACWDEKNMINGHNLMFGVGFESLENYLAFADLDAKLSAVRASGVSISVGRADWNAFAWPGHEENWAPLVSKDPKNIDPVQTAITALARPAESEIHQASTERELTLVVDAFTPRIVAENPSEVGFFADGTPSEHFTSAYGLLQGESGKALVSYCEAVAKRYQPDCLAITELIGEAFFSEIDEEIFTSMSGLSAFPRRAGKIITDDPNVLKWQSEVIAQVVANCAEAAQVPIEVDVRVNWDQPGQDRLDSGHSYALLLKNNHRLMLWAYAQTAGKSPSLIEKLELNLASRFSRAELEQISISLGLWGQSQGTIQPRDLIENIRYSLANNQINRILITPISLMNEDHWGELNSLFN